MTDFDLRLQKLRTRTRKLPGTSGSGEKLYHNIGLNCRERNFNGGKASREKLARVNGILLTKTTGLELGTKVSNSLLLCDYWHGLFSIFQWPFFFRPLFSMKVSSMTYTDRQIFCIF